jgi:hypothetical protein
LSIPTSVAPHRIQIRRALVLGDFGMHWAWQRMLEERFLGFGHSVGAVEGRLDCSFLLPVDPGRPKFEFRVARPKIRSVGIMGVDLMGF